jgi:N-acetylglutamate synthase-like GNAT family acetyltransferase
VKRAEYQENNPQVESGWNPEVVQREDVPEIVSLLASSAPETIPLSAEDVGERLADFVVLRSSQEEHTGQVIAVAALSHIDRQIAELSSVAVRTEYRGQGLGRQVVSRALLKWNQTLDRGQGIVCFTYRPGFFAGLGFEPFTADDLPQKKDRPQTYRGQPRRAMKWRMSEVRA